MRNWGKKLNGLNPMGERVYVSRCGKFQINPVGWNVHYLPGKIWLGNFRTRAQAVKACARYRPDRRTMADLIDDDAA